MRPRSPEGKVPANRTRSPNLKQAPATQDLRRTSVGATGAVGAGGSATPSSGLGSRGAAQQQQPVVKRGGSSTVEEIRRIDMNREQRRRAAEEVRRNRQEESAALGAQCGGAAPDIDFHRMIRDFRQQCPGAASLDPIDPTLPEGIAVCVRKRPIQQYEIVNRELDCVTARNPFAIVHERKFKVDGITKCLESHQFEFDRVFDEDASTDDVYTSIAQPLVPWAINRSGRATVFAYGQTGSGKTYTMTGIQRLLSAQVFDHVQSRSRGGDPPFDVTVSFFEIYGGRPYDLLNSRQRLETLEDARNEVQIAGLTERPVHSPEAMLQCIELGNSLRTTHATAINRDSSRSHAVCAVVLRAPGSEQIHAKITLVDLAGSERAADSKSSIRQRRVEGAQINKSLLALKECIRAMGDPREAHIPFRASKLTLVLRDAFVSRCPSKTVMIACISPGITSADHSVNTLRYSDRLKDHPRGGARPGDDDAACQRRSSAAGARESRSPEPRAGNRRRSPSPSGAPAPTQAAQQSEPLSLRAQNATAAAAAAAAMGLDSHAPDDHGSADIGADEDLGSDASGEAHTPRREEVVALAPGPPSVAWGGEGAAQQKGDGCADVGTRGGAASAPAAGPGPGGRQSVPRRGRQPTLGGKGAMPHRPDALGTRSQHGHADAAASNHRSEHAAHAPQPQAHHHHHAQPHHAPQQGSHSGAMVSVAGADRVEASSAMRQERSAPHGTGALDTTQPRSPERLRVGRSSRDLLQQDNRYLHQTLTSEVVARRESPDANVVDVGVQDLADIAHMEALDEVRQWEDRIVSQHMVALQEDARLLTAESELLSQVQQGAAYDIDRYVSEVDKVVRRKMQVYAGFLQNLEAFKSHLKREEYLSQSCQRNRSGGSELHAAAEVSEGGTKSSPRVARREGVAEVTEFQRTLHTPRPQALVNAFAATSVTAAAPPPMQGSGSVPMAALAGVVMPSVACGSVPH